jgi:PKD repeat protein
MKRVFYFILILPIIFYSCKKTPVASFSADMVEPEVGQSVIFINNSHDAERFAWDFGDGYSSTEKSPSHIFNATGSYEVIMTAISKSGLEDKASLTINVLVPTLLEIEVREYYSEKVVPNASIILYSSITDWDAQTNKVIEGFTDADGIAVFSNLDPYVYYVDVWEATHDNYTLRNEDVGFIRTPEVLPHKISTFIAWVDVVDHGKGVAGSKRELIIKKLVRKASDKRQSAAYTGTEDWQKLYNRRVGQ